MRATIKNTGGISPGSVSKFVFSPSVRALIFTNLVTVAVAVIQGWNLGDLMWVYWSQSVIIGFFQFFKILDLKNFSTENFLINKRPVQPTTQTKVSTAWFFAFHYGFFHLGYLLFLVSDKSISAIGPFFVTVLGFFINHYYSYFNNKEADSKKVKNIGQVMIFPYIRIIPMHLTIIFGRVFLSFVPILLFMVLKTFADVVMHAWEHSEKV